MKRHIRNRHTLRGHMILIATPLMFLVAGLFLSLFLDYSVGLVLVGVCIGWLFGISVMYKLDREWLMDVGFRFGKELGEDMMYFEHFEKEREVD